MFIVSGTNYTLYTKRGLGAYYEPQSDDEIPEYSIAMLSELFDLLQKFPYQTAEVLSDMKSPERKFYFCHMELKDTHEQVGSIGDTVEADTPVGKLVHLGYFTYPRHWGNGYTSEALKKVLEYAFTQDNVYRVTTGCLAENKGSERVMQKNGLIKEAEHIDYEWHDGKMKTRLEYRLLKHEWEQLQKTL